MGVDLSNLVDIDGLPPIEDMIFAWAVDDFVSAYGSTFIPDEADGGKQLTCQLEYTDLKGHLDTVTWNAIPVDFPG